MNGKSPSDKPESGQTARPAHELGNWLRPAAAIQPSMTVPNVSAPPAPNPPQPRPIPAVAIPPEAAETAEELFGRLRRMNAEGKVALDLDLRRLMHIDSPVAFEAESNQWVYGLLIVTAVVWYAFGSKIGIGAATASVLFYLTIAKAFLRRRIERRVREQVLEDLVRWRKLWTFGVVTIREMADAREGEICTAPRDNWMDFVRRRGR